MFSRKLRTLALGLAGFAAGMLAAGSAHSAQTQVAASVRSFGSTHPCGPGFFLPGADVPAQNGPPPTSSALADGQGAGVASSAVDTSAGFFTASASSAATSYTRPECFGEQVRIIGNSGGSQAGIGNASYSLAGPVGVDATGFMRLHIQGSVSLGHLVPTGHPQPNIAYFQASVGGRLGTYSTVFSHSPHPSFTRQTVEFIGSTPVDRVIDLPFVIRPNGPSVPGASGMAYSMGMQYGHGTSIDSRAIVDNGSTASGSISASLILPPGYVLLGATAGFPIPVFTLQTISLGSLPDRQLGGAPFSLSATVSSGLPVSFASLTPTVCSVSGSSVTLAVPGTCTIAATQSGDATYTSAVPVTQPAVQAFASSAGP